MTFKLFRSFPDYPMEPVRRKARLPLGVNRLPAGIETNGLPIAFRCPIARPVQTGSAALPVPPGPHPHPALARPRTGNCFPIPNHGQTSPPPPSAGTQWGRRTVRGPWGRPGAAGGGWGGHRARVERTPPGVGSIFDRLF